jgi:hypothetical protein
VTGPWPHIGDRRQDYEKPHAIGIAHSVSAVSTMMLPVTF